MDIDFDNMKSAFTAVDVAAKATNSVVTLINSAVKKMSSGEALDETELKEIMQALRNDAADAKLANADLKEVLADLKTQLLELKSNEDKFKEYELHKTVTGHLVFKLKETENGKIHYICPTCKEDDKLSILQGGDVSKRCLRCKSTYHFSARTVAAAARRTPNGWQSL